MSTVTTPRPAGHRRLYEVGTFVHERVTLLQEKFLLEIGVRKEPAQGVLRSRLAREINAGATLANLRRGIGKKVGELPALWQITLEGLLEPDERVGDDPTPEEQAAYTAITLYALHQQSRREGMHQRGRGLGTAVATLARRTGNEAAVRRRFEALGTAESFPEVVHHARGLVTQLRGENIGLDYGLFADQLYWLQWPQRASRVRLAWGREYYQTKEPDANQNDPSTPDTDTDNDSGDLS